MGHHANLIYNLVQLLGSDNQILNMNETIFSPQQLHYIFYYINNVRQITRIKILLQP